MATAVRKTKKDPGAAPVHPDPIPDEMQARVSKIHTRLRKAQPAPEVELDHDNAWQLLVATILAARSNDRTINS
ncbi:MAG: hypothetical protein KUG77_26620, partial [Nannocystaceae bacterium]|nr:hypothetical protein [Nannocystaceae bacterium]